MTHRFAVALALTVIVGTGTMRAQQQDPATATDEANPPQQQPRPPDDDPGFVDKVRNYIDKKRVFERFGTGNADGVYLRFGGMTTGSGISAGPGYRTHVFGDRLFVDLSGALSTKVYKVLDAQVRWMQLAGDRIELWTNFRYQDFTQEDYFGTGPSSSVDAQADYRLESTDVVTRALARITPWLRAGVDIGFFNPSIRSGTDDQYPSVEEAFTDATAPGLAAQPNFVHNTIFAEVDYRDQRGSPTRGGFYRISFGTWEDVTLDQYDFRRFDGNAAQFVSLFPRHVLVGHAGFSFVNNEPNHRVPFYFLPYAGGSDTLRGFREFRFRDENMLTLNAEYRWQAMRRFDVALFFDAGEVRPDWEDIDLHDLKTSYGLGFRVHTTSRTVVRLDIGTGGREGTRVFFKLGPSF